MKVYVVDSYYDIANERYLEKIFSTLEKAKAYCDERSGIINDDDYDGDYYITEYEVD
jgi:hypothetical protein